VNPNTRTELGASGRPQLYNLEDDLAETRNVAMQHPEKVAELARLLDQVRAAGHAE
jgi:hypothetical protein